MIQTTMKPRQTMKNHAFTITLLILILCQVPSLLYSQHDLTLYNFETVPQRIYENPSFIPAQRLYIGIPFLSGAQTSYENPFSYNNVLTKEEDDSLTFEAETFIDKISKNDHFITNTTLNILSVGAQIADGRYYLNFGIRQRSTGNATLPEDLCYLLWYGNTAPQVFGETVNISPVFNGTVWDEWDFTFSGYAMNRRLSYGATVKYLSGRINVNTKKSEFDFYTDTTTYNINVKSDVEIQTSGIDEFDTYFNQPLPVLIFPGNFGFGIDLGASFCINDKFSVNASVLDLGFITWRSNTLTLVSHEPGAEVIYNGLDLHDFVDMVQDFDEFGTKMTDSISDLIDIDSVYDVNYTTYLPVRYNIGGSFAFNDHSRFNLLFNGISQNHKFYPALSLSWCYNLNQVLGIVASYNLFNNQYWNFGAGLSVQAGPVQLYAVSDNLPGLIAWKATNNSSIQVGINVSLFGKKPKAAKAEPLPAAP